MSISNPDKEIQEKLFALRFNETMSYLSDISGFFTRLMTEAASIMNSDLAFMFISPPNLNGPMTQLASNGQNDKARAIIEYENGILIEAAQKQRPIGITASNIIPMGYSAAASAPIKNSHDTIGYMFFLKKTGIFCDQEISKASFIASSAGQSFENLKRIEKTVIKYITDKQASQKYNEYYSQIGQAITSERDLGRLLNSVASLCADFTGADSVGISVIENGSITLRAYSKSAKAKSGVSFIERERSLLKFKNGKITYSSSYAPSQNPASRTKYYLGIPIISNGESKAVINIYSNSSDINMTSEKMTFLESVAKQTGLAIENARNYESGNRRAKEAETLYNSVRAISCANEPDELFSLSLDKLQQTAKTNRCLIFKYDKDSKSFSFLGCSKKFTEEEKAILKTIIIDIRNIPAIICKEIACGTPRVFKRGYISKTKGLKAIMQLLKPAGESILVPLVQRNEILGAAYLYDTEFKTTFSQFKTDLLKTLSAQITISMQRIRLLENQAEQNRRLQYLLDLSSQLPSARSLSRISKIITEQALSLKNSAAAAIILFNSFTGNLLVKTSANENKKLAEKALETVTLSEISRYSHKTNKSFILSEQGSRDHILKMIPEELGCQIISFPISFSKKKCRGALIIFSEQGGLFPTNEIKFIKSFSEQAISAIKNAYHEETAQTKMKELAILFDTEKKLSSSLEKEKVLNTIAELLMMHTDSDAICVMLAEEQDHAYGFERTIKTAVSIGLPDKYRNRRFRENDRLISEVFSSNQSIMKTLIDEKDHEFPKSLSNAGIKTILAVPMKEGGITKGILNVYRTEPKEYTEYEINLLQIMADLAAGSIVKAEMYAGQKNIAETIQSIMKPAKKYNLHNADIAFVYTPKYEISGDFFDIIPLGKGRFSAVMTDVSGKGHSAAIYTVKVKYLMKAFASAGYSPSEILAKTNSAIIPETEDSKFISLIYIEIDTERKTIKYSSAGHEPGLFYSKQSGSCSQFTADGLLIGISDDAEFEEKEMSYSDGDIVALYTDGITESTDRNGNQFGFGKIAETVKKHASKDAEGISQAIVSAVKRHTKRDKFHDDLSLLVIKF